MESAITGEKYFAVLVDEATRYVWIGVFPTKDCRTLDSEFAAKTFQRRQLTGSQNLHTSCRQWFGNPFQLFPGCTQGPKC